MLTPPKGAEYILNCTEFGSCLPWCYSTTETDFQCRTLATTPCPCPPSINADTWFCYSCKGPYLAVNKCLLGKYDQIFGVPMLSHQSQWEKIIGIVTHGISCFWTLGLYNPFWKFWQSTQRTESITRNWESSQMSEWNYSSDTMVSNLVGFKDLLDNLFKVYIWPLSR